MYLEPCCKTVSVEELCMAGPKPYVNKAEESELAEFLEVTSSAGYGKTRKQVMEIVESTAQEKGLLRKAKISQGWFCHFIECQPQLLTVQHSSYRCKIQGRI